MILNYLTELYIKKLTLKDMGNLKQIIAKPLDSNDKFISYSKDLNFDVTDFWKWALSDLIENRNRGILAEFIVMQTLGVEQKTRMEWDSFDIETKEGIKIEVKSSAYFQAWEQKKKSSIIFGIAPTRTLLKNNKYSKLKKRHSDIYIFCIFDIEDENINLNPLNMNQWTFYLVKTVTLNNHSLSQKNIALSSLEKLAHIKCTYTNLENEFNKLFS